MSEKSSCSKVDESGHQVSDEQVLQISGVEPLSASEGDADTVNATSAETKEIVERVAEEREKFLPVSSDQDISKSMLLQESVTSQETDESKHAAIVLENVENQKQDLIRAEKSQENLTFPADEIATEEKPEASAAIKNVGVVIDEAVAEGWEAFGSVRNIVVTAEGAIEDEKVEKQEAATNVLSVVVDSTQDAVLEVPEASAAVQSIDAAEDIIVEEQEASTIVKSVAVDPVLDSVIRPETSAAIKSVDAAEDGMTGEQEVSAIVKNVVVSFAEDAVTIESETSVALQSVDAAEDIITEEKEASKIVKSVAVDSVLDSVTRPETSVAVQSVDAAEYIIAEEQEASTIVKSVAVDPVLDSVTRPETSAAIKSVDAAKGGMTGEQEVSAIVKNVVVSLTEDAVTRESETSVAVQSVDAAEDIIAEEASTIVKSVAVPVLDSVAERPTASGTVKREDSDYATAEEREDSADQDWIVDFLEDSAAKRSKVYESVKNLDIDDPTVYANVKNVIDLLELAIFGEDEVSATIKKVVDAIDQVHEASASVKNIDTVAEETEASSTTIKGETLEAAAKGNEIFLAGGRLAYYDTEAIFREMDAAKYSDRVLPACYKQPSFDSLFKKKLRDLNELSLAAENLRKFLDFYKHVPQLISADETGYVSRVTIATERDFPPKPDVTQLGEELNKVWIEVQQSLRVFLRETKDLLKRHRQESPKLRLEDVELYLEKFHPLRAHAKDLQNHAEGCRRKFRYNFTMSSVITNLTRLTQELDDLLLTVYFALSKLCVFDRRSTRCPTSDLSDFLIFL